MTASPTARRSAISYDDRCLATALARVLSPRRVLVLGDNIAGVVSLFADAGLEVHGLERSALYLQLSPAPVRPRLDLLCQPPIPRPDQSFDVVLSRLDSHRTDGLARRRYLREMERVCRGTVVLDLQGLGADLRIGPERDPAPKPATPLEASAGAEDALEAGQRFELRQAWARDIAAASLAPSPRTADALAADADLRALGESCQLQVLHPVRRDCVTMARECEGQVGGGFWSLEDWGGTVGPLRWTASEGEICLKPVHRCEHLLVRFYSGPREIVFPRRLTVHLSAFDGDTWRSLSHTHAEIEPDRWERRIVPARCDARDLVHVRLRTDPVFNPHEAFGNNDGRDLGIAIQEVSLLAA